ncbi:MAG: T9SS type A sorting domain-containing protein, partial [Bacteroidia bacterium]|nr:T9SS type A sorting domain-containing protein [Bacteroidia bacterium]
FILRQDSTGETPFMVVDELRLGTSWADVTPTTLGVDSFSTTDFTLYPNPNKTGILNIASSNNGALKAQVFNVLGKEVIQSTNINGTLDVSKLSSGLYIVKLSQGNASVTKKLVIE